MSLAKSKSIRPHLFFREHVFELLEVRSSIQTIRPTMPPKCLTYDLNYKCEQIAVKI